MKLCIHSWKFKTETWSWYVLIEPIMMYVELDGQVWFMNLKWGENMFMPPLFDFTEPIYELNLAGHPIPGTELVF